MGNIITAIIGHLHYAGLFLLLLAGGMGFPVPEDLVLLASGLLASTGVLDLDATIAVIYTGMLISDLFVYSIGKRLGPVALERGRFKRFISPARLALLEEKFRKRGVLVILAGRHLAGLRVQIFLAAGIMRMPRQKFMLADAFSAAITMGIMVGLGYRGGESLQVVMSDIRKYEHLAIAAGVGVLACYLLYHYIKSLRRRQPG